MGVHLDYGCGSYFSFANDSMEGKKLGMARFVDILGRFTDRPGCRYDESCPGRYDFVLPLTPEDYRSMLIRSAVAAGVEPAAAGAADDERGRGLADDGAAPVGPETGRRVKHRRKCWWWTRSARRPPRTERAAACPFWTAGRRWHAPEGLSSPGEPFAPDIRAIVHAVEVDAIDGAIRGGNGGRQIGAGGRHAQHAPARSFEAVRGASGFRHERRWRRWLRLRAIPVMGLPVS